MPAVLHVGPSETPGGMATVIRILSESPPSGWEADVLNSHASKGVIGKLLAWRRAKKILKRDGEKYDVIHFHSASDWSFKRKCSLAKVAKSLDIPVVMHIHSGGFANWAKNRDLSMRVKSAHLVFLTAEMAEDLASILGNGNVIQNPVVIPEQSSVKRDSTKLLLLARKDDVKGHDFAISLVRKLRSEGHEITLDMTGIIHQEEGITGHGWVSESKRDSLLDEAGILLVPSEYEGQPMVILEASARGLPVVASEISTPNGVTRVPLQDNSAWSEAILSGGGIGDVSQNDINIVKEKWGELYNSIADTSASTE